MRRFLGKLRSGTKTTVVALGDSITELTWHTQGRLCWVGYLQEALFETYGRNLCWVINSGRCGDTAEGGHRRLEEDVFRFDPDLVIISYGMNDSVGVELPRFRETLGALVDRVRDFNDAEILLRTPNPIVNPPWATNLADGQSPAVETEGTRVALFAQAIVEVAAARDCPVVDHYAIWKKREALRGTKREEPNELWMAMSDSVHPGPLGHLAFFREMAPLFGVPTVFPWEAQIEEEY
jgi:lysophospholipase L1-like esterase